MADVEEEIDDVKDAYYSATMDKRSGAHIYMGEDGCEVRTNLVVPLGEKPNTGFDDVLFVGRVTRWVRRGRSTDPKPCAKSAVPAHALIFEGAPRDLKELCGLGRFNLMRLGEALGYERDAFSSCSNEEAAQLVFLKLWEADGKTEWPWFGEFSRADFDWMLEQCQAKSKGTRNLYVFEYTKTTNGGKLLVCMDIRGNGYYMRALDVRARDASKAIWASTWASTVATAMNALRLYPSNYEDWVAGHAKKEEAKPSEICGSCDGRGCPTCKPDNSHLEHELKAGRIMCTCGQVATATFEAVDTTTEGTTTIAGCVYCVRRLTTNEAQVQLCTIAEQSLGMPVRSPRLPRRSALSASKRELAKPHPWELDEDKVI